MHVNIIDRDYDRQECLGFDLFTIGSTFDVSHDLFCNSNSNLDKYYSSFKHLEVQSNLKDYWIAVAQFIFYQPHFWAQSWLNLEILMIISPFKSLKKCKMCKLLNFYLCI